MDDGTNFFRGAANGLAISVLLWCLLFLLCGCTSSGPVFGPFSAVKRFENVQRMQDRGRMNAIMESNLNSEKKLLAIQAIQLGDGERLAAGLGINLAPVVRGEFTKSEIAEQTGWALLDLGSLAAAGAWAYDKWIKDEPKKEPVVTTTLPGHSGLAATVNASGNSVVNYTVYYAGDDSAGGEGGIRQ